MQLKQRRRTTQPLYRQVANLLIEDIASGRYEVGGLLPPEPELVKAYGVSRHTLREAVRHVQSLGMIERRQGHGTRIKSVQENRRYALSINTFDDVEQHGYFTHLVDIETEMVTADGALGRELPCDEGARLLKISCYRVPTNSTLPIPTARNETYIVERYAAVLDEIETLDGPLYGLIERRFGERVGEIVQEISAVTLTPAAAQRISARKQTSGIKVKRSYIGRDGTPILFGYNTYAANDFSFVMRLINDGG